MSLNRYEQAIFDYWTTQPDERRHWQGKADEASRRVAAPGEVAREFERELWEYFVERRPHVASLRALHPGARVQRVSFLNLAEHVVRLWGVPPRPRKAPADQD
jgi:hypothetical protein